MSKIESIVWAAAEPMAARAGCSLYDVEFVKEGVNWFLRIVIDKEGGVSTDDCEAVSKPLSDWLDEVDPITQSYYLEVSSPGIDRKLTRPEHFAAYLGQPVTVRLYTPWNGKRQLEGVLSGYEKGAVTLSGPDGDVTFEKVVDVRLTPDFNEPNKKK